QAIALKPGYAEAFYNRGVALQELKCPDEAVASYNQAIALKPGYVEAFNNRAVALRDVMRWDEALASCSQAIALKPGYAEAFNNRGTVLEGMDRLDEALASYDEAIRLKPDYADAIGNRGTVLKDQAHLDEALAAFRTALDLDPSNAGIHSNLLFNLHYREPYEPQAIFAEHRNWAGRHASPQRLALAGIDRDPDKRLRIGYVSADLRTHSVSFFLEPLLAARDRGAFDVICYANSLTADTTTARLQALAEGWRHIGNLDDEQAAAVVQADAIDILVDLSGHTPGNRLTLFSRKPAPIQVTYLGYPDTSGVDAIDYRFTDEWADPPGRTEQFHTEKLVRLPQGFLCYLPPASCPPVSPLPMLQEGHVTFGSFNNLAKVSPTIVGHWAAILAAIPGSRLLLKSKALAGNGAREHLRQQFRTHGIDAERVELIGWTLDRDDHMNLYGKMDIALETFPYHGTTTSCDALWMGVPVITLAGPVHVSRVGVSLLHAVGLDEMIAETPADYLLKAVNLAGDAVRLGALRSTLRERMRASPLTDARRIAGSVEDAYRQMWRRFCQGSPP
ncbi:MAG TPA: tetratricopeptide repeat protein, partial [Micropepsaceae bacterium]|nr:tetratricopeptide repeat protein [Micropepsaceae bacterium]